MKNNKVGLKVLMVVLGILLVVIVAGGVTIAMLNRVPSMNAKEILSNVVVTKVENERLVLSESKSCKIYLNLDLPERNIQDLGGVLSNIGLTEFISVINKAKSDNNIKAIMLNVSILQANGIATAQEIRECLESFSQFKSQVLSVVIYYHSFLV